MLVVVVTGGLGAGKSTAAEFFRSRGASVLDLDDVARELLAPGSPTLAQVVDAFGASVLRGDGSLDRAALARKAFGSADDVARLNAITHPAITEHARRWIDSVASLPAPPDVAVIEVPLIVEVPEFHDIADIVLAISAPCAQRIARAVSAGVAESDALDRIRSQATDEQRAAVADFVIANDGDSARFLRELVRFWGEYIAGQGGAR